MLEALAPCAVGRVGVSPPIEGLVAVDVGYRTAHTAARTLTAPGLARLDDRLPEALVVDNPTLAPRLVEAGLGGLLDLPPADRDTLLRTLEELLACGGSPTHTAAALLCSATATPSSTGCAGSRPSPAAASATPATGSC